MFKDLIKNVRQFVDRQSRGFLTLLCIYVLGSVLGAIAFAVLSSDKQTELVDYYLGFVELFKTDTSIIANSVFYDIWHNILIIMIIGILGAAIVGIPFIILIIIGRGFITGFTSMFLIISAGFDGAIFVLVWLFISEVCILPFYLFIAASAITYSMDIIYRIRRKALNQKYMYSIKKRTIQYCVCFCVGAGAIVLLTFFNSWLLTVAITLIL